MRTYQIHGILWASDSESDVDQSDFDPDSDRDVRMPLEFEEDYLGEEQAVCNGPDCGNLICI